MSAVHRPLSPVEPQLPPEAEDACWAILDAWDAAQASGDADAILAAAGALVDFQLRHGLMTRDELRRLMAPHLLDVVTRADEMPEGRALLARLRDENMEALNGDDYSERTAAALFIMTVDAVQAPRLAEARRVQNARRRTRHAREHADWTDALRSIETRTNLACLLLWSQAWDGDSDATPEVENIREAWTAARGAKRKAQDMLESIGQKRRPEGRHDYRRKPGSAE